MNNCSFKINGMDCAEEVTILKREVGPLVGGADRLGFDILRGRMTIAQLPPAVSVSDVVEAVRRTGMSADPWVASGKGEIAKRAIWLRPALTACSVLCTAAGFGVHLALAPTWSAAIGSEGLGADHKTPLVVAVLYSLAVVTGVFLVLPKAWFAVRRLRPDMNLLMVVAVLGAIGIGEWLEAAVVSSLFSISLLLESWSVGRARRAVESLLSTAPAMARVKEAHQSREVSPSEVAVGSHIIIKPGELIPLDGRIVRGHSNVNQAPITGESVPVSKQDGDEVYAGTINGDGTLEVSTTKHAEQTTLALIIRLIGEAQSRRAPSEQWVEKFARFYTPVVLMIAVSLFVGPPLLFGASWSDWLYRSLVLLVIACPCALVISTPVSIVAGLAGAASRGILIKGGVHLEAPARLRAIAFDKTGTLTEGKLQVVKIVPVADHTEAQVLQRAAAMETQSEHPIARAIVEFARRRGVFVGAAEDFQILQGKGAVAKMDGQTYWIGSHRYLEERQLETPEVHRQLEDLAGAGHTVVALGTETSLFGFIALKDTVRPAARTTVESLKRQGIEKIIMLTGDNKGTATAIASETGVDEVLAELLPQDKVSAIEATVAKYGTVAMVGDGVNDAPSLARATVGIAMGAAGSDAAIEAADIALMSDDISKLPWLITHSRRTLSIIRQNIAFSLAIKAIFVGLTLVGHGSLWAAIAADTGASLVVIFNGLRLLRR